MSLISAIHVRAFARMFHGAPEVLEQMFRGSGISVEDIDDPEFQLPIQSFWTILDNIVEKFGQDWFLNFPILWSPELQTEIGLAMRMSANLGAALDLVKDHWLPRWPIGDIDMVQTATEMRIDILPKYKMKEETWAVALAVLGLNFATMHHAVTSAAKRQQKIRYEFKIARPSYADRLMQLIDGDVSWGNDGYRLVIPNDILNAPSVLANKKQLAHLLEAIKRDAEPIAVPTSGALTKDEVLSLLNAVEQGQAAPDEIAKQLGLSKRSLERRLMEEGTSFRELATASLKNRISALLLVPGNNAETIAFQLGYHDGSSVMRACKRWFGKPMSKVRAELRASA